MGRPAHNTTKLPRQLADELATHDGTSESHRGQNAKGKKIRAERKAQRKAERDQKKQDRRGPHRLKRNTTLGRERRKDITHGSGEKVNAVKSSLGESSKGISIGPKSILKKSRQPQDRPSLNQRPEVTDPPAVSSKVVEGVRKRPTRDDEEIAALEKKLGVKGNGASARSMNGDGFDGLLDGLVEGPLSGDAKRKREEGEEWLHQKRRKAESLPQLNIDPNEEESEEAVVEEVLSDGVDVTMSDDDCGFDSEDDLDSQGNNHAPPEWKPVVAFTASRARENPYVPPTTASSTEASTKYIPPSLRDSSQPEKDALVRLRRQAQGILNRLTEANLVSILKEVEQLYANSPRQHVTSTLVGLLIGLVRDRSSLSDSFIILHAGLIAAIYKVIGLDFGVPMVTKVVESFDDLYRANAKVLEIKDGGKETVNLISLLSELYNLQTVGSSIMFDFIRHFLNEITEINTELLLKIIKSAGPQLRREDPSTLKDVVLLLQQAVAQLGESRLSVRTKYMIETINDLKNNKLKTGAGASSLRSEALTSTRKILSTLNSRKLQAVEPLRVNLQGVRDPEKKGKWWLSGASLAGNVNGIQVGSQLTQARNEGDADDPFQGTLDDPTDLLWLAKQQHMNTDVRRAIFITIMSATDWQDAHLRLTKLRLKRAQEMEIPRVLIHCAGAEQSYNPYYTLIARKLCADRKLKMAFQFSLWGLFKAMGEHGEEDRRADDLDGEETNDDGVGMRKTVNLAKMFGTLIANGGLGLGVLKTLDFAYLQPNTQTFVELLLVTLILLSQHDAGQERIEKPLVDIFATVNDNTSLARGLQYFLKTVVSKTDVAGGKEEKTTVKWGCKVARNVLASLTASAVTKE